jgi:hypothetical protein
LEHSGILLVSLYRVKSAFNHKIIIWIKFLLNNFKLEIYMLKGIKFPRMRMIILFFITILINGNISLFAQTPPTLTGPADGSGAISIPVILKWDTLGLGNPAGTKFWVEVSTNPADWSAPVFSDSTHTDTTISVPGLNYSTTYYWRVAAGNTPTWSAWSAVFSFTTMLPVPNLLNPLNGATKISLNDTLRWTKDTTSATGYRLQISLVSNFASLLKDTVFGSVNDTSKILWGLSYGKSYYWRVKFRSATDSSDWASAGFTTISYILVTAPNTNVNWVIDSTVNITWVSQGMTNINIEYSVNGGNIYYPVASGINALLGTFAWTVPDSPSVQCKIRISDASEPTVADSSDTFFTIPLNPAITVTLPNGGEVLAVDSAYNIKWTKSNISGNALIEYTKDNGVTYTAIATVPVNNMSYAWVVPNTPGTQCRIRISNEHNAGIADSSDATFVIPSSPAINITSPAGTESWAIDSTVLIQWTRANLSGNVKIEYSTNNGTAWNDIVSGIPVSKLSYQWVIPNGTAGQWKIRITNEHNPGILAVSNAFNISAPSISITSPVGTENWGIDSTVLIRWNRANLSGTVKIELSTDNGVGWNNIATGIPTSQLFYQWTLPNSTPGTWKIRITNENNPAIQAVSNAFTIAAPSLAVTSPNGGESWVIGSVHNITWTRANLSGNVKIEFSSNGGDSYTTIVPSISVSALSYAWTVTNSPSLNCKIRIINLDYPVIADSSNAVFTIPVPLLALTAPNGGETWISGSTYNITWTGSNLSFVKLEYSTDSMASWNQIIASTPGSSLSYSWNIPVITSSTKCFVRISDAVYGTPADTSDAKFEITSSSVNLTAPNNLNEKWQASTTHQITWTYLNVTNVLIEYTTNNGANWNNIATRPATDLSYNWVVPDYPSTQCRIRISNASNTSVFDISDSLFTIARLRVTSPNGGEHWQYGKTKTITWTAVNTDTVLIEYSTNNGTDWVKIVDSLSPAAVSFDWVIPAGITSSVCKIKITDRNGFTDISDNPFTIYELNVTAPNGGEYWQSGRQNTITWNSIGIPNVKIDYTLNNGLKWINITPSAAGNSYTWLLPDTASANCRIRVSSAADTAITDSSDAVFSIIKLKLLKPTGGEFLHAGSTDTIKWSTGDFSNLNIEFTTNDGITWQNISSNASPSPAVYPWIVPNFPGSLCRVRITNKAFPSVTDSSSSNFAIYNLDVTSPNGGEYWQAGTKKTITWTDSNLATVKIEYSTDRGSTFNTITASAPSGLGGGSYDWDIPLTLNTSTQCRIRISNASESRITDTSNANFTIYKLNVTSPNTNMVWKSGSLHNITWSSGNIANVNINYSTDNGLSWLSVASNIPAAAGTYAWRIPAAPSKHCLVKVTSYSDSLNIYDISDTVFTISSMMVLTPNGGESWKTGTIQQITWTTSNISAINIEYSTNNGLAWIPIAGSLPASSGIYNWVIPGTLTTQGLVRIIDSADVTSSDTSDHVFTISNLVLTSPNGGERWQVGSRHNITWTQTNLTKLKLEYSTNIAANIWNFIDSVNASDLSYSWAIPDNASGSVYVRISDNRNLSTADTSNSSFTICKLIVNSPNGGEYWQYGSSKNITWTGVNVDSVRIDYSTNNGSSWVVLKDSLPNSGTFSWSLPQITTTQCKVRILDFHDNSIADTSNNSFTIYYLDVLIPNGGEYWQSGITKNITWQSIGIANLKLEYSTDGGLNYQLIAASTPAFSGAYAWLIPNVSSSNCRIRISDASIPGITDSSNALFTIYKLNLIYPNGGEYLQAGKKDTIRWTGGGSITTLRIEYSTNGGSGWILIKDTAASALKYPWNIPNVSSNQCLIRISDLLNPGVFDTSDARFTIYQLDVTYPNTRQYFQTGKNKTITWTYGGSISKVKLEYTTDNGSTWTNIATVPATPSSYIWQVPNLPTTLMKIRVSDSAHSSIKDTSDYTSHIYQLDVLAPNGGESWLVNSTRTIRWSAQSNITNIKLEYSTNNGGSWQPITGASNLPVLPTFFNWKVPNTPSTTCRVKISSASESNYNDSSDNIFNIRYIDLCFSAGSSFTTPSTPNIEPVFSGAQQVLTINAVLRNNGDTAVSNIRLAYMLAADTTVTSGYIYLDSMVIGSLAAQTSVTKTLSFSWPQSIPGDAQYYVGFWVDRSDTVTESNRTNNRQFISPSKLNNIWKPDLVCIEDFIDPPNTSPDDTITIYYKLANLGLDTAGASVMRVYYSRNTNITTTNDSLIGVFNLGIIDAGQTLSNRTISVVIPHNLPKGLYYVKFFVDATSKLAEMKPNGESNNFTCFSAPFRVFYSNLTFTYGRYFPTETGVGDNMQLVSWITNADTGTSMPAVLKYSMTPDNSKRTPNNGDPFLGTKIIPKLGPFETWKDTSFFAVPGVNSGFHWVGAWVDTGNTVKESNDNDNKLLIDDGQTVGLWIQQGMTIMTDESTFSPTCIGEGGTLTVKTKVANWNTYGTLPINGTIRYYLYPSGTRLGTTQSSVTNLYPQKDTIITWTYTFVEPPGPAEGRHYMAWGNPSLSNYKNEPYLDHTHSAAVLWDQSTFSPDTIGYGMPWSVTAVVKNMGLSSFAAGTRLYYYLSADQTINQSDYPANDIWWKDVGALSPGQTINLTYDVTSFPPDSAARADRVPVYPNYFVGFYFSNAFGSAPQTYYIYAPHTLNVTNVRPDLKGIPGNTFSFKTPGGVPITDLSQVIAGDSIYINAVVLNDYNGPANKNFSIRFYLVDSSLVTSSTWDLSHPLTGATTIAAAASPVMPFTSRTAPVFKGVIPADLNPGTYFIGEYIDCYGDIPIEVDKANNKYPRIYDNSLKVSIQSFVFNLGSSGGMFANIKAHSGTKIGIPVKVKQVDGISALYYKFTMAFDSTVIQPTGEYSADGTICSDWDFDYKILSPGLVQVFASGFGRSAISDTGTIVILYFNVIGETGKITSINFPEFRLSKVNLSSGSGKVIITDGALNVLDNMAIPLTFKLEQNYPNPFNPTTTIRYAIPYESYVTIKIYDILGREVKTIIQNKLPVGWFESAFDARNLATGVYFYRIQAKGEGKPDFISIKKMLLIK